jgi:two-component system, sensor histidine kinase
LSDPPPPVRADARIDAELYRTAYAADRRGALAGILAALFAASALQNRGAPASVWIWAGAYVALALSRLVVLARRGGDPGPPPSPRARTFRRLWLSLLTVSAAIWGAGPPVFLSLGFATGGLLSGIWLAAAALSAPLVAAARPAIYLWLVPSVVPLLFALALYGSGEALVLAVLGSTFLLLLLRLVLEQNDSLAAGLAARFRSEDLVELLQAQVDLAARANQEKTRFLASAVHDLRQPLHALGLFCAALDQRLHNIPERPLIKNMMASIEALETSFGAMLDISRLDAGVVRVAPQTFPVRDVFRRLYQQFGGDAEARDISLRFRAVRRRVLSDPQLLERVLANLVQNALRYTQAGGVLVAARRRGPNVALEVWDTGVGIAAEQLELIFEEFYQIDNPGRDHGKGVGLGLAIVRRLSELIGGTVQVNSQLGQGTRFDVRFPATLVDGTIPRRMQAGDLAPSFPGRRIYVVDDEPEILRSMQKLLGAWGIEVMTANSTRTSERLFEMHRQPDLMIVDLRLNEEESGVQLASRLRGKYGNFPILIVTGETSSDALAQANDLAFPLLQKPIAPEILRSAIADALAAPAP